MKDKYNEYNEYKTYANDVLSGNIIACKYIILACKRYLSFFEDSYFEFRPEMCDKVINFIFHLKHYTGRFNGKQFILSDWQKWIIYNIFGFYYKGTNDRVTKNVYLEVARKNGKTAFAAALCLYSLFDQHGAECELIANSRKQAGICFDMCNNFCSSIPNSRKHFKQYRDKIKFEKTKSFLQVLSSDSGNNDGWNSSFFIADEAHEYPDSKMYDVMKSSQGMRDNAISMITTTAGFNLFGFCYQVRSVNIEILEGLKKDDSQFTAIYTLDEEDDYKDESVWIKSNPNLGITVRPEYLKEMINRSINNPSEKTSTITKNFNKWLAHSEEWLSNDLIKEQTENVDLEQYRGLQCVAGVDLSTVSDLSALSIMIPDVNGYHIFKTWYFLPEKSLTEDVNSEMYKDWHNQGKLIITEGNVIDYDYILKKLIEINKIIYINAVYYDKWNATQFAINATNNGLNMQPFSQAIGNFNRPTKEFERLICSKRAKIDDNQITRWCINNCELKYDWNENCKPTKGKDRTKKIDGVISMIQCLGGYMDSDNYSPSIFSI